MSSVKIEVTLPQELSLKLGGDKKLFLGNLKKSVLFICFVRDRYPLEKQLRYWEWINSFFLTC